MSTETYKSPLMQFASQTASAAFPALLSCIEWRVPPGLRMVVTMLEHDDGGVFAFGVRRIISAAPVITAVAATFQVRTWNPEGFMLLGTVGTVGADPGLGYVSLIDNRQPQYPRIVVDGGFRLTLIGTTVNVALTASIEGILTVADLDTARLLVV